MELILVRHAETEWNSMGRCQGVADLPLSECGREQARRVALSLGTTPLSAVYTSDLRRAVQTAREVAALHGLEPVADRRLREMDQGRFEGLRYEEIKRSHADFLRRWRSAPEVVRIPDGETLLEVQGRMLQVVDEILERHAGGRVAVVSHQLALSSLVCGLLGLPLVEFVNIQLAVASRSVLRRGPRGFEVVAMNDVSHLAGLAG